MKLQINKKTAIVFNDKQNFIVGVNGSGKTTLFYLIQYVLGLRSNPTRLANLYQIESPYLECKFGDKILKISRKLDSSIVIFEGDIVREVKANSFELNELYADLLGVRFLSSFNDRSALDILGFSFFSELDFKRNNTERHDTYNKILGVNPEYLNAIQSDIKNFENQINSEKQSIVLVEQYKKRLEVSFQELASTHSLSTLNEILDSEFLKIREHLVKNYELLQNAQNIYNQEKNRNEEFITEKLSIVEPFFYDTMKRLNIWNNKLLNLPLKSIMRQKNYNIMSFGEKNIIFFILHLTFCRELINVDNHNGLGLLVTDDLFAVNDYTSTKEIYEKIFNVTDAGELQYIGFSRNSEFIPKEYVIFDISPKQGGGLFER